MLSEAPKEHNFFKCPSPAPGATLGAHDTRPLGVCAMSHVLPALSACAPHAPVFASSYGTLGKTTSVAPGGSGCGGGEPSGREMSWRSSHLDGQRRRRHHRRVWTGGWAPLQPLLDHPSGKGAPLSLGHRGPPCACARAPRAVGSQLAVPLPGRSEREREREGKPVLSMRCHAAAGTACSDHAGAPSGGGLVEQLGHHNTAPLDHLDLVGGRLGLGLKLGLGFGVTVTVGGLGGRG